MKRREIPGRNRLEDRVSTHPCPWDFSFHSFSLILASSWGLFLEKGKRAGFENKSLHLIFLTDIYPGLAPSVQKQYSTYLFPGDYSHRRRERGRGVFCQLGLFYSPLLALGPFFPGKREKRSGSIYVLIRVLLSISRKRDRTIVPV